MFHNQRTIGSSSLKQVKIEEPLIPIIWKKKLKNQWFSWKNQRFDGLLFDFFHFN
jgi:hypothetical protein